MLSQVWLGEPTKNRPQPTTYRDAFSQVLQRFTHHVEGGRCGREQQESSPETDLVALLERVEDTESKSSDGAECDKHVGDFHGSNYATTHSASQ